MLLVRSEVYYSCSNAAFAASSREIHLGHAKRTFRHLVSSIQYNAHKARTQVGAEI